MAQPSKCRHGRAPQRCGYCRLEKKLGDVERRFERLRWAGTDELHGCLMAELKIARRERDAAVTLLDRVWESEAIHEGGWQDLFCAVKEWRER